MPFELNTFLDKLKQVGQSVSRSLGFTTHSAEDTARRIMHHAKTVRTTRCYLGLTFHDYHLRMNDYHFCVETKEISGTELILRFTVTSSGEPVYQYRSYLPGHSLKKKWSFDLDFVE